MESMSQSTLSILTECLHTAECKVKQNKTKVFPEVDAFLETLDYLPQLSHYHSISSSQHIKAYSQACIG